MFYNPYIVSLRILYMKGAAIRTTKLDKLVRAYLRGMSREKRESGFVFPDGEWIPLGDLSHDRTVHRMFDTIVMPKRIRRHGYALAHHFGVIHVTAMGHVGIDANVEHVTTKQLETLAARIIESVVPDSLNEALFNMHHHPRSEIYHGRLQRLVGDQYKVGFVA